MSHPWHLDNAQWVRDTLRRLKIAFDVEGQRPDFVIIGAAFDEAVRLGMLDWAALALSMA